MIVNKIITNQNKTLANKITGVKHSGFCNDEYFISTSATDNTTNSKSPHVVKLSEYLKGAFDVEYINLPYEIEIPRHLLETKQHMYCHEFVERVLEYHKIEIPEFINQYAQIRKNVNKAVFRASVFFGVFCLGVLTSFVFAPRVQTLQIEETIIECYEN